MDSQDFHFENVWNSDVYLLRPRLKMILLYMSHANKPIYLLKGKFLFLFLSFFLLTSRILRVQQSLSMVQGLFQASWIKWT